MLRQRLFAMHRVTRCIVPASTTPQIRLYCIRKPACIRSGQRRDVACAAQHFDAVALQGTPTVADGTATRNNARTNGVHTAVQATRKLTFQEAITALERYWAEQSSMNCAILLPHNTEVRLHPVVLYVAKLPAPVISRLQQILHCR